MKQLNLLAEVDFSPLSKMEALSTKGGGWITVGGQYMYCFDEVTVVGEDRRGIDWERVARVGLMGTAAGGLSAVVTGASIGSPLGPAGTVGGAIAGGLAGAAIGGVTAAYSDYCMQSYGY